MTPDLPQRGEIRWALVPHVAEAPVTFAGVEEPLDFAAASAMLRARGARNSRDIVLPAVIRPVLILHGWESASHGAYVVLRTRRLEALSPATREAVLADAAGGLVLLDGASAGHERAAMIAGISRLHGSAIDHVVVGRASAKTMRRVSERIADRLELDLGQMISDRVDAVLSGLDPA